MFSKETYMARRAKLKQTIGSGLLLFLGNDESGMNYADNTYHFRQDSTFLYFFGLPYAGLSAIIDIDNDKEIIFGDELTIDAIVWMGTQPTLKEKSEAAGIKEVRPFKEIETYLKNAQQKGQPIHYLPTYRAEHQIKLFQWLGIVPGADKPCLKPTELQERGRNCRDRESLYRNRRYAPDCHAYRTSGNPGVGCSGCRCGSRFRQQLPALLPYHRHDQWADLAQP
mgnify:CR=1 FL=1